MTGVEDITPADIITQPHCAVCHHPLHPHGFHEWQCDHRCRCVMIGCVPRRTPPQEHL